MNATTAADPKRHSLSTATDAPPDFEGMGSVVLDGGTGFRVWAPNAKRMHVTGSFNEWADPGVEMMDEGNGHWRGYAPGATAGDQYKFRIGAEGGKLLKTDPRARAIDTATGNGLIYRDDFDWQGDDFATPPLNEVVLYELHAGTFGREDGKPGGFKEIIKRLPYLRDLGVNAIELLPPTEFPGHVSWGYNPNHPFAVEADYGGPDGLKELIRGAHRHGIAVVLDIVYNHFGPDELDLWQFDGWSENGGGGIYFYNDSRGETPWGNTRPDYGRDEVRRYLRDNAVMWIEEFRADGLRLDAVSYIRTTRGHDHGETVDLPEGWQVMQWINKDLREKAPACLRIAEDLGNADALTTGVELGGAGFDTQWDAGFVHPVRAVLESGCDDARDLGALECAITRSPAGGPFCRVIYTESHDEVANGRQRVVSEIDADDPGSVWARRRALQAAGLVLSSPGVPMMFQGQEFLEDGWFDDSEALDWEKCDRFPGIVRAFRDLIHLRRNLDARTRGLQGGNVEVFHQNHDGKVLAWHRWYDGGLGDSTVVIMNCSATTYQDYAITFPADGEWRIRFNADWEGYSGDFGAAPVENVIARSGEEGHPGPIGNLTLPPYALIVLSQEPQ